MKCKHCDFTGRGRTIYKTPERKDFWVCPECNGYTEKPPRTTLPSIKGYCKDCKFGKLEKLSSGGEIVFCSKLENDCSPNWYCADFKSKEQ